MDPESRKCERCVFWNTDTNEEPCRSCLRKEEKPGYKPKPACADCQSSAMPSTIARCLNCAGDTEHPNFIQRRCAECAYYGTFPDKGQCKDCVDHRKWCKRDCASCVYGEGNKQQLPCSACEISDYIWFRPLSDVLSKDSGAEKQGPERKCKTCEYRFSPAEGEPCAHCDGYEFDKWVYHEWPGVIDLLDKREEEEMPSDGEWIHGEVCETEGPDGEWIPGEVCETEGPEDGWKLAVHDSGERREFASGARRDMAEGKGRCDLLPFDEVAAVISAFRKEWFAHGGVRPAQRDTEEAFLKSVNPMVGTEFDFTRSEYRRAILEAAGKFAFIVWDGIETAVLDLAVHFEVGALKYEDRNWEKGVPAHSFLDSAVRHYLKWQRGDRDEDHASACLWNLVCLAWTLKNRPECDDLTSGEGGN